MYLTIKQQLKLPKEEFNQLKYLCHIAKNLYNEALYLHRHYYIDNGMFLSYTDSYHILKNSPNYKILNSDISQQLLMDVEDIFKGYDKLLTVKYKGNKWVKKVTLPRYLPKDGYYRLCVGLIRLQPDYFMIPYSLSFIKKYPRIFIKTPPILKNKIIKEIRIVPKYNATKFEIHYIYEADYNNLQLNKSNALAIDFGVNNLCTCVTNTGKSFIIDGKRLKSINQGYYKELSRLQQISNKQKNTSMTDRMNQISFNRRNESSDYIYKAVNYIIEYCKDNDIGTIVAGYSDTFQYKTNLGTANNQSFVSMPFAQISKFLSIYTYLNGMSYFKQDEAYTSKASFFDKDPLPNYGDTNIPEFSGKRVKRGLYRTKNGYEFNADVNGALNILRKSNVVSLEALYGRGEVDTPIRIRIK